MDDLASKIAQFYLYDTLTYSNDSLRAGYANMGSITGELLLSGQYMEEGNYLAAITTINGINNKHSLNQSQVDGLLDLAIIYAVLNGAKADSLSTTDINTLLPIAYSNLLASGHARAVLLLNGFHFDPVYYGHGGQPLQSQPFIGSPILAEKQDFVVVYPNPASNELYIHVDSDIIYEENVKFELFDLQGRLIFSDKIESRTFKSDFNNMNYPIGVYPYRIITESNVLKTGNLIIEY
jgi:hypothetical protein